MTNALQRWTRPAIACLMGVLLASCGGGSDNAAITISPQITGLRADAGPVFSVTQGFGRIVVVQGSENCGLLTNPADRAACSRVPPDDSDPSIFGTPPPPPTRDTWVVEDPEGKRWRMRDITVTWSYLDLDRSSRWRVELHPIQRDPVDFAGLGNPLCVNTNYAPPRPQTFGVNTGAVDSNGAFVDNFGLAGGQFVESDTGRSLSVTFRQVAISGETLLNPRPLPNAGAGSYRVCLIAQPLRARGASNDVPRVVLQGVIDMGTGTFVRETGDWRGAPPPDLRAPRFIGSSPATGATQVPTAQRAVSATFDEAIAPAALGQIRVVRQDSGACTGSGDAVAGAMSAGAQATSVVFTAATDWLPGVRYCATAQGQRDAAGNEVTPTSWAFTTAVIADVTPPTIVTRVPAADATNVEPGSGTLVQIRFSEPVNAPAGSITVTQVGTATTLAPAIAGSGTDQLVLSFAAPGFLAGTSYEVAVTSQVRDLAGNAVEASPALSWRFTTRGSTPPPSDGPLDCGPLKAVGGSWQAARRVESTTSFSQAWPRIGIDCSGTAHAAWLSSDGGDGVGTLRAATRAASAADWPAFANLGDSRADVGGLLADMPLDVATAPNGRAALVYVTLNGQLVAHRRAANDTAWGSGTVLGTGLSRQARPRVGVDSAGNVLVVYSKLGSLYQQVFSRRFDATAGSWQAEAGVPTARLGGDTPELRIALAMSGSGDAVIAYKTDTGPQGTQIMGARFSAGAWQEERRISTGSLSADALGDPQVAVDGFGNATIAWNESQGTFGGSTQVQISGWSAGGATPVPPSPPVTVAGYSLLAIADRAYGTSQSAVAVLRQAAGLEVRIAALRVGGSINASSFTQLASLFDFFPDTPKRLAAAMDEDGVLTVAWHVNTDIQAVRWAGSLAAPSAVVTIDGSTGFVDENRAVYLRAGASNGRAIVIWAQQTCSADPCNNAALPMNIYAAQHR